MFINLLTKQNYIYKGLYREKSVSFSLLGPRQRVA